jgi:hypothetical protein
MPERGKVHANLMCATRLETAPQQCRDTESLDDLEVRARGLPGGDDRHRRAVARMAADRRVDDAARGDVAARERGVLARHAARLHLANQRRLRGQRLRDDHQTARVLVRADGRCPRAEPTRAAARGAAARSRACRPSCRCRVHDEAGRLVDDEERFVFVHDVERDRFGCERHFAGSGSLVTTTSSPPRTRRVAAQARRRASRGPRRSTVRSRLREYCGNARASAASKRSPAALAGSATACVVTSGAARAAAGEGGVDPVRRAGMRRL